MYETTIVDPWKVCPICNKSYKGYHNCNEHTPADMPQIAHFSPSTSDISINQRLDRIIELLEKLTRKMS